MQRIITGIVLVVVISMLILTDSLGLLALMLLLQVLATVEYNKLILLTGFSIQKYIVHTAGPLWIFISYFIARQIFTASILLLFIPLIPVPFIIELFRKKKTPFENIGLSFLGTIWISLPLALFILIGFLPLTAAQTSFSACTIYSLSCIHCFNNQ
jgi:hypothetical protein